MKMKITSVTVVLLLVIGALLSTSAEDQTPVHASTRAESNNSTPTSSFHVTPIPWGEMQAQMEEQVVNVSRYGGGRVHMAVSYQPFFFQYFPVWVEINVANSPSWLIVTPSQKTFVLQQGETETDDINLAVSDDVEAGTIGLVELEVEGRTIILPSLLDVSSDRASFIVRVQEPT